VTKSLDPDIYYDQQLLSCAGDLALACTDALGLLERNQRVVEPPTPQSPLYVFRPSADDREAWPCSLQERFLSHYQRAIEAHSANPAHLFPPTVSALQSPRAYWRKQQALSKLEVLLASPGSNPDFADTEGNTLLHFSS